MCFPYYWNMTSKNIFGSVLSLWFLSMRFTFCDKSGVTHIPVGHYCSMFSLAGPHSVREAHPSR